MTSPDARPILFDQYSRYRVCAEFLGTLGPSGSTLLDVGSGPLRLIGRFLPGWNVTYLDPLLTGPTGDPQVLGGRLQDVPLEHDFDWLVCVDTLEHIPPADRTGFLDGLSRIARKGFVLACPCSDVGEASEVDAWLNELYRETHGVDYPWLEEHVRYGLPECGRIVDQLRAGGWHVEVRSNGHAPWLRDLLGRVLCLMDHPRGRQLVEELSETFNETLYDFDDLTPSYRQVVIATREPLAEIPAAPEPDAERRAEAARRWEALNRRYLVRVVALVDELGDSEKRSAARQAQVEGLGARLALMERQTTSPQWLLRAMLGIGLGPIRSAASWLRTAFLRVAKGVYHRLPLPASVRWRLADVFFRSVGHVFRGTPVYDTYRREREWRSWARDPSTPRPRQTSAVVGRELPDVFFWGIIDWHFRTQRPQHLARGLAALGYRVFYVAPHFVESASPGFVPEPLDGAGRLFNVRLHASRRTVIYERAPAPEIEAQLMQSMGLLLRWAGTASSACVVQHPFWYRFAAAVPASRLCFDQLDHLAGFSNTGSEILEEESRMLRSADLVLTSSARLLELSAPANPNTVLLRNACEYEHFSADAESLSPDEDVRPVVGYYGAIADWFDVELVRRLSTELPDVRIELVGADTAGVGALLADRPNVEMLGEAPYSKLPGYLRRWSVAMIPFVENELTRATDPVKVYEYLSSGKPVVTTNLPELEPLRDQVRIADSTADFVDHVVAALSTVGDAVAVADRRAVARSNTWDHRVRKLHEELGRIPEPSVSVVIVTYGNLELTRRCIASIEADEDYANYEIVVVDNASTDGTPEYLGELERSRDRVQAILNDDNKGFAAANNQGIERASGEYLVLLNNDTVVTSGWLRTLVGHLRRDSGIGVVGPVTNNIGNEARIPTRYSDMDQMRDEAREWTFGHLGKSFEIGVLGFFCVALSRRVVERVGQLDEQFGMGFFEDDDYCQRIRGAGLRVVCVEDVFIHHELSASFNKLAAARREELFERNRAYYETKWGPWKPHSYRSDPVAQGRPAAVSSAGKR